MKKMMSILAALAIAVTAFAQGSAATFEIKSGKMVVSTEVMGQKMEATSYFDNYGALQMSKTEAESMMGKVEMGTIIRDGKTYMVDYIQKSVQEMPAQESINYLSLDKATIDKYKVKEVGKETVGGKECTKYTAEISQMGQTAKVEAWVWKGIPMKTVTDFGGMSIVAEVTELSEEAVDASVFEVPKF